MDVDTLIRVEADEAVRLGLGERHHEHPLARAPPSDLPSRRGASAPQVTLLLATISRLS
jgi:hypothetical protein